MTATLRQRGVLRVSDELAAAIDEGKDLQVGNGLTRRAQQQQKQPCLRQFSQQEGGGRVEGGRGLPMPGTAAPGARHQHCQAAALVPLPLHAG